MTDEQKVERIGELVRELDPAPDTPVEEIWTGIVAARRYRTLDTGTGRWRAPAWGLGLAASLLAGIAIGRLWADRTPASRIAPPPTAAAPSAQPPAVFRQAAADHLVRTEALLAAFPSGAREGRAPEVAAWARQLLLDTRLLRDSPANIDTQLAPLLEDLELILAQIASLRTQDGQDDIRLIEDGIAQNRIIARLRQVAVAAAGVNGDN